MARPKSYPDLIAWQKAMALARNVYTISEGLPKREAYGPANQMRRAAVSVASNIAEGYGRLSDLQFRHFLGSARGSLYEARTQMELATVLGYLKNEDGVLLMEQSAELARVLNGLIASLGTGKAASSSANPADSANPANAHVS